MYWMLSQKAQNADRGTDLTKMLTKKARAAVNKAMHLLAIELNLEKGTLEHTIANAVAKRSTSEPMQSEVQTEELLKSRNLPPFPQAQKGKPKEDLDRKGGKPTDNCAGCFDEDRSTVENGIPKRNIG